MKKIFNLIGFVFLISTFAIGQSEKEIYQSQKVSDNNFQVENVESFSDGKKVWLSWQTKSESNILGYNIYRSNGSLKKRQVNASILPGSIMSSNGRLEEKTYSFIDSDGDLSSIYFVEAIDSIGNKIELNPIYPQYTNDLSTLKGDDLNNYSLVTNEKLIAPPDAIDQPQRLGLNTPETTQRWIASQPGVKITVNREGFYRVTKSSLQAAGFNIASDESLWQLYADGVEQGILVNANDIEFYGKGIDTISTDKRVYYLVVGTTAGKRITNSIRRRVRGTLIGRNFESSIEYKEKLSYASGILNGDTDNFFGKTIIGSASTPTPTVMTINIPNPDTTVDKNDIEIAIQPLTAGNHTIQVLFNDQVIGTIAGVDRVTMFRKFGVAGSFLVPGNNTLKFIAQNGSNDVSIIMSANLIYKRKYESVQNRLNFYTQHYQHTKVGGFSSSNVRVFDISDFTSPKLITNPGIAQNGATFEVNLLSNRTRSMYAVEESGIQTPISITANVPSTISSGSRNANLIIISHGNFMTQAETWANYRRGQGLTVEVVNIEDVFDEFNFGYTKPEGIRTFFQYVYTNWTNVKYALLIGDATYDYRGYLTSNPFANYIPTKLVDTVYLETGSDETLADFNDDGLAEIAVGRIPIRDVSSLNIVFNKITAFETNVANALATRGALFVSDEPNGYDFVGINTRVSNELPSTTSKVFTYKPDSTARTDTLAQLNQGRFLVNWSGHGNTAVWSSSSFINKADMAVLTNSNSSIFTLLTCLNGYYVDPTASDVFGEAALKNPNGGAAAVWASSGLTTADIQEVMAKRFYNLIGNDPSFTRIGDLIKDSKTTIPFGRDVRLTWSFLGDPSMKVK